MVIFVVVILMMNFRWLNLKFLKFYITKIIQILIRYKF